MQWNNHQRVQWLEEVNDTKRYSVRHLACCAFTLEKELRQNAQLESWVLNGRSDWLDACERLEAKKLEFRSSRLTLQEIALQGVSQSHQKIQVDDASKPEALERKGRRRSEQGDQDHCNIF